MLLSDYKDDDMNTITQTITRRIRAKKRGWVFTPKDFLDVGSRAAIDQTLSRLAKQGIIRRLDRGIYDFPKKDQTLGMLSPSANDLAQAVAAQTGDIVFPSGASAANFLGLSTQVPAKPVFMTNGSSRTKQIAGRSIKLQHARVPISTKISDKANFVLQALYYLGKNDIDDAVILKCANHLDKTDFKNFSSILPRIPWWMADLILRMQNLKHGQIRT